MVVVRFSTYFLEASLKTFGRIFFHLNECPKTSILVLTATGLNF